MHAHFTLFHHHISSAADIIISRTTYAIVEHERNSLWGYPALYGQFEEEVLPAMRAVDELRSRPSQVQQQSQNVSRPEGSGPPTADTLPQASIIRSEDEGGQAEHAGVSTTGLASDSNGRHVIGLVASDGDVNTLYRNSASISSTIEPISVVGGQDIDKAPSLPPIAEEAEAAQASDDDNVKALEKQGPEAEKAGEAKACQARTPGTESSPIPPEIEMEDLGANRVTEADPSVCFL